MKDEDVPTVLVKKDDEAIREMRSLWLQRQGCRVIVTGDGAEAVPV